MVKGVLAYMALVLMAGWLAFAVSFGWELGRMVAG
jgi:hypothetical protein